jgi:hypothetical protein
MALCAEVARIEALEQAGMAPWSKKAADKIAASIRAHKKELDRRFEHRVLTEIKRRIETVVLPSLLERERKADLVLKTRRGVLNKADYRLLLMCLHPDMVMDPDLKPRYEAAFHLIRSLEVVLLGEKDLPTMGKPLPRTWAEVVVRRRKPGKQAVGVR